MKSVLVLGAGQSSPYLIRYLLEHAASDDFQVVVADRDLEQAAERVGAHPRGEARPIDATSPEELFRAASSADLVINLMPPGMQRSIVHECMRADVDMLSVSYATSDLVQLSEEARELGLLMLFELGVDPGIDHMATMALLDRLRAEGKRVTSFVSYGGGLPAPDSIDNPLGYAVTWNPRNVVMAGADGALFVEDGRTRAVPPARVFEEVWPVEVASFGELEAYANRDSLSYVQAFGLEQAETVIRATLRYPGWCATWQQIVKLGLNNEAIGIPELHERSFADLVDMFLPHPSKGADTEARAAAFLGLETDDVELANLRWLGLFSTEAIGFHARSATQVLTRRLAERLRLPEEGRDVVILQHELQTEMDGEVGRIRATLIEYGERGGMSAMARTVGLPTGIAARLILSGELEATGCLRPTERAIYEPVLEGLAREGLEFQEEVS